MMSSLLSVLLLTGALAGSSKRKRAVVEGTVAGLPDGTVRLQNQAGVVATSSIEAGKFRFEFDSAFPNDYYLHFGGDLTIPIVIEKDVVYIEAELTDGVLNYTIEHFAQEKLLPVTADFL